MATYTLQAAETHAVTLTPADFEIFKSEVQDGIHSIIEDVDGEDVYFLITDFNDISGRALFEQIASSYTSNPREPAEFNGSDDPDLDDSDVYATTAATTVVAGRIAVAIGDAATDKTAQDARLTSLETAQAALKDSNVTFLRIARDAPAVDVIPAEVSALSGDDAEAKDTAHVLFDDANVYYLKGDTVWTEQGRSEIVATVIIRRLYLYDTLANLNTESRHGPNIYAVITADDSVLVSNGNDTWTSNGVSAGQMITMAADKDVLIVGNLDFDEAENYLRIDDNGVGARYQQLGEDVVRP